MISNLTIGILSWESHRTLQQTLESYKKFELDIICSKKIIYFQNISNKDIRIAKNFGYEYFGTKENVGIAVGFKNLINSIKDDYVLFLENDWRLLEDPKLILTDAIALVNLGDADVVKLRSRCNPGIPLWSKYIKGKEREHQSYLLECIHWNENPDIAFSEIKKIVLKKQWYVATSKNANWSNNPFIAKIDWLKNVILPKSGIGDIERDIQFWWEKQDFKVAQGDGLFTHDRIDRGKEKAKWL
jgi:hypothetical protein